MMTMASHSGGPALRDCPQPSRDIPPALALPSTLSSSLLPFHTPQGLQPSHLCANSSLCLGFPLPTPFLAECLVFLGEQGPPVSGRPWGARAQSLCGPRQARGGSHRWVSCLLVSAAGNEPEWEAASSRLVPIVRPGLLTSSLQLPEPPRTWQNPPHLGGGSVTSRCLNSSAFKIYLSVRQS